MDTTTPPDVIPGVWRTRTYVGSLLIEVFAVLVVGVLVALELLDTVRGMAVLGAVTTPLAILNSGLGTGYRPTRTDGGT